MAKAKIPKARIPRPRGQGAKIPEGITDAHRERIKEILGKLLKEIWQITRQQEILVNCRLNFSGTTTPSPIFVGWMESQGLETNRKKKRLGTPIGSTHPSPIYSECLDNPGAVRERDFSIPGVIGLEKSPGALGYDVLLGLNFRRYICIKAGGRCTGTLTVGLCNKLGDNTDIRVREKLKECAQDEKSELVKYLQETFQLGGPLL